MAGGGRAYLEAAAWALVAAAAAVGYFKGPYEYTYPTTRDVLGAPAFATRRALDEAWAESVLRHTAAAAGLAAGDAGALNAKALLDPEAYALYEAECEAGGFAASGSLAHLLRFDAATYAQFARLAGSIDPAERMNVTRKVGRALEADARAELGYVVSGDPSDVERMREATAAVLSRFVETGYLKAGKLLSFVDSPEARRRYAETGEAVFEYFMDDPVILPSAQRLFKEHGFAQHFSSRTLEALFDGFGVVAREDESFDPNEHPSDGIVERWSMRRKA